MAPNLLTMFVQGFLSCRWSHLEKGLSLFASSSSSIFCEKHNPSRFHQSRLHDPKFPSFQLFSPIFPSPFQNYSLLHWQTTILAWLYVCKDYYNCDIIPTKHMVTWWSHIENSSQYIVLTFLYQTTKTIEITILIKTLYHHYPT